MCVVCGCASGAAAPARMRPQAAHPDDLHFGANPARVSVPGLGPERTLKIEADVLGENDRVAAANRTRFAAHRTRVYNFVSSPGSGKTTLLVETLKRLRAERPALPLAVIEGDQQTSHDADRIRATGVPAIQVNTGKGCHLDAPMVAAAAARLPACDDGLLLIENVGNLVCPAMWDLGERAKVALLAVTEGDDKPVKYPDLFAAARLIVLTKTDLLPHVDFDVARCLAYAQRVNPSIELMLVSAKTGQGMDAWLEWLTDGLAAVPADGPAAVAADAAARPAAEPAGASA